MQVGTAAPVGFFPTSPGIWAPRELSHPVLGMQGSSLDEYIHDIPIYSHPYMNNYESGWWFQPLWKILVNWDDYSKYMGKKMFQTTNQWIYIYIYSHQLQTAQSCRMDESFRAALGTLRSGPSAYLPKVGANRTWRRKSIRNQTPGWWYSYCTPLKNMSSSIGMMTFPIFLGK